MTRKRIFILLALVLCLSGCGKSDGPTQKALDFRTKLMESEGCSFTADITADYGDKLYVFSVDAVFTPDETKLSVVSPEAIAGITATVSADGAKIEFDGVELDFGKLANGYVSPVSVPWLLGQCWLGEYIAYAGTDGDLERVTYLKGYNEEELTLDTWLSEDDIPVHAEVFYGGERCLTVEIRDFQF